MTRGLWLALISTGCTFQGTSAAPHDDATLPIDVAKLIDAPPDVAPDARTCFGSLVPICLAAEPSMPFMPTAAFPIDTDSSDCTMVTTNPTLCVVTATEILINFPVVAHGMAPLVLLATGNLTIGPMGLVDVASHQGAAAFGAGHDPATCTSPSGGGSNMGGGGGGGGGGFAANGGNGGTSQGAAGNGGAAQPTMTSLRGGCSGASGGNGAANSGGAGGGGGGLIYLVAGGTVTIAGEVNASGAGGGFGVNMNGGGGGGGAGGMIAIDGAMLVTTGGRLIANGGGGGGGGDPTKPGKAGNDPDPAKPTTAANGGTKASPAAGDGGAGGVFNGAAAINPGAGGNGNGAGGGGGSLGSIRVGGNLPEPATNVSPVPTR